MRHRRRRTLRIAAFLAASVSTLAAGLPPTPAFAAVPHADRVVVVIMENQTYHAVRTQPYTASLIASGGECTNSYGIAHPSQPNYFALFAGSTLSVTNNNCPAPGYPFYNENLGHACEVAGLTWRAYSENLAIVGSTACSYNGSASSGLYTRKHAPWTYFFNLNHNNERPYTDLSADIAANTVPKLVFVVPNNCHNTHNFTTAGCGIPDGDLWLSQNLPAIQAALGPNGVLILTWDEDDNNTQNHILTVFSGPLVVPGSKCTRTVTHFTVVRTITDLLGLPPINLAANETPISEVFDMSTPTLGSSWGRLKVLYR